MENKFYVTTPIYYINDKPHIGSTYTTVAADILARAHRQRGDKTLFMTGTDENSQKNLEASEKAGFSDMQKYLDEMAGTWQGTWKELGLTNDDFIRTTEERHHLGVEKFWKAVMQSGDIYKANYDRLYCAGCEDFKTDSELTDGKCVLHPNKELQRIQEENYFFKASAYKDELLKLYHEHPEFIQPPSRLNEIRNYVKNNFDDFSISRESSKLSCGIPVPDDDSQRIYVWFDALTNYMTAVGYGTDEKLFKKWWPADLHLVGKDIIKFHCALWPAMIMSAAKSDPELRNEDGSPKLPKQIFAHGFFTVNGQKMSKSLGNVVNPLDLNEKYPFDVIRYFLMREIQFGSDGDFSEARIAERYTSDLANTLGNLLNRAVNMSRKYFDNKIPTFEVLNSKFEIPSTSWGGVDEVQLLWSMVDEYYKAGRTDMVLEAIWNSEKVSLILANRLVEETQPFKLIKEDPEKTALVLYTLLEFCRQVAWMIEPVMPHIAWDIIKQLGQDPKQQIQVKLTDRRKWGGLVPGSGLPEPKILFPRLETDAIASEK